MGMDPTPGLPTHDDVSSQHSLVSRPAPSRPADVDFLPGCFPREGQVAHAERRTLVPDQDAATARRPLAFPVAEDGPGDAEDPCFENDQIPQGRVVVDPGVLPGGRSGALSVV